MTFLSILSGVRLRLLLGLLYIKKCVNISVQGPGHGLINILEGRRRPCCPSKAMQTDMTELEKKQTNSAL